MRGVCLLNYSNLNDVEFEYLCQDIMSKKLGTSLRRFAAGKDGGIDLTKIIDKLKALKDSNSPDTSRKNISGGNVAVSEQPLDERFRHLQRHPL